MKNQKGFITLPILTLGILVIALSSVGYFVFYKNPPSVSIPQLTKEQVLNGYDRCGVQFKNGEFQLNEEEYNRLDAEFWQRNKNNPDWWSGCDLFSQFSSGNITFADLDADGLNEALVPARAARASSGGLLYVFKNVNGVARAVDSIGFGKGNGEVVSIEGSSVVIKSDDGFNPAQTETYTFLNGHLKLISLSSEIPR